MNYDKLKNLVGIPWIYKESDCWAIFKRGSLELFGVNIQEVSLPEMSDTEENKRLFKTEIVPPRWLRVDKCSAGCAVLFYDKNNDPIHIALAIDDKSVLHSMGSAGVNSSSKIDKIRLILKHRLYSRCEYYDYSI